MGPGHRALGATSAAGALVVAAPRGVVAGALVVLAAVVTSGGALSPDVDQTRAWRRITGGTGACAHRRVTHWWAWPALLFALSGRLDDAQLSALAFGVAVGWGSHLAGDAAFGRGSPWRPAGIPLLPSRGHVGLGLPVGGRLEHWVTRALVAASWVLVPLAVSGLLHATLLAAGG